MLIAMTYRQKVFILQLAIAFVFLWFGVDKMIRPEMWIGWIPEWFSAYIKVNPVHFMLFNGAIEVVLALWILIPFKNHWAAFLTFLYFIPILIITGLSQVGIRDISLAIATLSLALLLAPSKIELTFKN